MPIALSKALVITVVPWLTYACAHRDDIDANGSRVAAAPTTSRDATTAPAEASAIQIAVGDPCTTEGWHPTPYATAVPDSNVPTATPVPPGHLESWQLPPGIGYCMSPGGGYPYGYFTMNCVSDSDCPGGARCDGLMCRRPCGSDGDCRKPTLCVGPAIPSDPNQPYDGGSDPLSFCYCSACVPRR